jgi:hypothetical protein
VARSDAARSRSRSLAAKRASRDNCRHAQNRHPKKNPYSDEHSTKPVKTDDLRRLHHSNPLVRFNTRLGLKITIVVGTMWCAYLIAAIALASLPDNEHPGGRGRQAVRGHL